MNPSGNAHEIHALSGAYAVDALEPSERVQFEEHLAACLACQEEIANLREAAGMLGATTPAEPPAGLRDRLLREVGTVRPLPPATTVRTLPVRRRLTALVAAASLIGVAGVGTVVWQQATSSEQGGSVADRVLQARDANRVTVDLADGASVTVVRSVSVGKAVLVTRDLPRPPSGRVYELWLQTPAGTMVPAGLLTRPGSDPVVLDGDATDATAAGITVEPAGGSPSPTSAPIALLDLAESA